MFCVIPIPAFKDNYIWLLHDHRHAIVVDPGDASPVIQTLDQFGLQLDAILVTHHHWDHIGGIEALRQRYPLSPVYGPATECIPQRTHAVADGDTVWLTKLQLALRIIAVPGHTKGHIAYYGENLIFCGDTLFAAGCGRLFEGTPEQLYSSLKKLADLPGETLVYCTHEYTLANLAFALAVEPDNPALALRLTDTQQHRARNEPSLPSNIKLEQLTNPFLRCHESAVKSSAEYYQGHTLGSELEVFTTLRKWKDNF